MGVSLVAKESCIEVILRARQTQVPAFVLRRYQRVDELIWVKTNQLQKLIRTGRTGHWLNHSKEHCIIGVKGTPTWHNAGVDPDVLVAEVRPLGYVSGIRCSCVWNRFGKHPVNLTRYTVLLIDYRLGHGSWKFLVGNTIREKGG
jgi:hypothetical protein